MNTAFLTLKYKKIPKWLKGAVNVHIYNLRDSYFTKVHTYFIHIVDEENISALMIFSLF